MPSRSWLFLSFFDWVFKVNFLRKNSLNFQNFFGFKIKKGLFIGSILEDVWDFLRKSTVNNFNSSTIINFTGRAESFETPIKTFALVHITWKNFLSKNFKDFWPLLIKIFSFLFLIPKNQKFYQIKILICRRNKFLQILLLQKNNLPVLRNSTKPRIALLFLQLKIR